MPSLPSKDETIVIVAITYLEIDTKAFRPFRFCLIYLLCPIDFFRYLRHFLSYLSSPFQSFQSFSNSTLILFL